jgi:hypothetical protein
MEIESYSNCQVSHRKKDEDFGKQLFSKHIEYLSIIDQNWADKLKNKYERLLK